MILTVSDYENSALFHRHSVFERAKYASERENVSPRAGVEREAGAYAFASIKRRGRGGTPKIYLSNVKKRTQTAS